MGRGGEGGVRGMAKLYMTDGEIVNSYRLARDPRRQISVLAELNAVPPSVIREVLSEAGELVLKPRKTGGGRPLSFDAAEARRLFDAGLSDKEMAEKLGTKVRNIQFWRQGQGLLRPRGLPFGSEVKKVEAPPEENKEETDMKKMQDNTAAEAAEVREEATQAEGGAVTVQRLCDLLRGAVDAGYGSVPVTVEGCRFAAMRLRVELLVEGGLVFNGRPVKVELEGTPEVPAGKEE